MEINIHIVLSEIGGSGKTSFSRYLMKLFGESSLGVDLGFPHKSLSQGEGEVLNISIPSIGKDLHSDFNLFFEKVFSLLGREIEEIGVNEVVLDVGVGFFFPILLYVEELRRRKSSVLVGSHIFFHFMIPTPELETSISWQTNMLRRYIEKDENMGIEKKSIFFWANSFFYEGTAKKIDEWKNFIEGLGIDRFSGLYVLPEADRATMDSLFQREMGKSMDAFQRERIEVWEKNTMERIKDALHK